MHLRIVATISALALLSASARAQCAIDQNQPNDFVYMAAFSQTDLAQSFRTSESSICGAGIKLQASVGTTDNVTIQLWTNLPNAAGVMLTSGSASGTQGQWCDVTWPPVGITPNTTYYLVFTGNSTLGIAGDVNDPYPNGEVYANPGYGQFPSFDYTFRTTTLPPCALDQNQPNDFVYMAAFSQTDLAQSFKTSANSICGAGIKLQASAGSTDNVTIELWTNLPNAAGVMLTSGSAIGTQGQWCDVSWPSVGITPNTTYYLVFTGNSTLGIAGDVNDPYPNGEVYANPGYGQFPTFDYTFRTFSPPPCPLDQNQPNDFVYMAGFGQTDLAQSFQTPQNSICGAGIKLQASVGTTDNVTIELWTNLPNAAGTLLASGSGPGTQGEWVDVTWPAVSISPNTTYYLVFSGNFTLGIAGDVNNPYPNGQVYANPGYGSFPAFDYTFRTFGGLTCGTVTNYCTAGTTTNGCNASMSGTGTPSASAGSGFVIAANGVEGQKSGLLFYGLNNSGFTPSPWGASSSFLCVKAPTQRTGTQNSGGTAGACNGTLSLDFNTYLQTPGVLGNPFSGGETVFAQGWFRDPPSPKQTHLSDGLTFVVCP